MKAKLLATGVAIGIILIPSSAFAASYTIQPGDMLSNIAASHNISLESVEASNTQIPDYNLIFPNQIINLPDNANEAAVVAPPRAPVAAATIQADSNLLNIFAHESSQDPYAINAFSGACGLGQSLPCSKLLAVCGNLGNVDCQVNFFTNYALNRYGSTAAAWRFWQAHRWW